MAPWGVLLGSLGLNYWRHRHGRSTICAVTRRAFNTQTPSGRAAFLIAWAVLSGVLVPHILRNRKEQQ